ncbi:MAG: aminoacyl-tRNA hydrolase [Saprospiraceae bacterium]|nr:aminoacyl-tRNA hydrolase [Bacteroidia bacterium]NNE15954.1 aminoacyl-tRNA hydrolase [Saprospiraceae bacterium]NNL93675.1 aminoacyl-tRNA hydrolase [Saprospiraceae bacterium]
MIQFFKRWFSGRSHENDLIDQDMKYLIVGLGNMHPDYDGTRHNIGFEVLDMMAKEAGVSFKNDTLGDVAMMKSKGRHIHLLKPSTYMNLSGKSVRYWMTKHKVKLENVLVVVDDKNIDFGTLRMRGKGADGGHNGLKNIQQVLGTSKYSRLRVGIGSDFSKGRQVDFVLGKWSNEELEKLGEILGRCSDAVLSFTSIGLSHTMNKFNK